jgi:hypothetical protein
MPPNKSFKFVPGLRPFTRQLSLDIYKINDTGGVLRFCAVSA